MNVEHVLEWGQWFFMAVFLGISCVYLLQNIIGAIGIHRYLQEAGQLESDSPSSTLDLPVSLVVPVNNESASIVTSVKALLQQAYFQYELVVVNDGSSDDTLQKLIDAFDLKHFPAAYRKRLPCGDVRRVYRSASISSLYVIDKEHAGSKADAINAGVNACRYPVVCVVNPESVLQPGSLRQIVRPFLEDSDTVAVGGTARIVDGCGIRDAFLEDASLPRQGLPLLQVVEHLRALLFGRMCWSSINALLEFSGVFGAFHKETLVEAGGYNPDAISEDIELIVRLHRIMKEKARPYKIAYVPDALCWNDAPKTLKRLKSQRVRWQHGLGQALVLNRSLMANPRGGAVTWFAIPFCLVFEFLRPILEVSGYLFFLLSATMGWLGWVETAIFLGFVLGLGVLVSTSSVMLEELSLRTYPRTRDLRKAFLMAILENFGFRQLTSIWRLQGLFRLLRGPRVNGSRLSVAAASVANRGNQPPIPR